MSTTAWRFRGTEEADEAVLRLKQLAGQELIDVHDVAVLRWPLYAAAPQVQDHVTDEGSKAASLAKKFSKTGIEGSMIDSVKGDMTPGSSALVLLSTGTDIDAVAKAFEGHAMELMRSDLSVKQEDQLRAAFEGPSAGGQGPA